MGTVRIGTPTGASDRGSIVVGWLTRIAFATAIFGVLGYDGVAIIQGHVNAADDADQIAQQAHETWSDTHSVDKAFAIAKGSAATLGDTIPAGGFTIEPKSGLVVVKVKHSVDTLLAKRFGFSRPWATMTATGEARDQS